ncbi:MAG TPA: hypothetical protein VHV80_04810 [Steroidobacteraceae bacterium]|jgi:hypothetical protein|nr:hypothetical protein [Steroidobacteraceae bacterium]
MKARIKTNRWLPVSLFLALMAAAGLALTFHDGVRTFAKANDTATPPHTVPSHLTLVASLRGTHTGKPHFYWVAESSHPDIRTPEVTPRHFDSHSNASTGSDAGWGSHAYPADGSIGAPQPQHHPATAGTHPVPQPGAGDFANQVYAPQGCGLAAGCGVAGNTGHVVRQTSGTSGGLPAVHNSQGPNSGNDGSSPPPNYASPQTNDSGQDPPPPGQGTTAPGNGSDPPTVSAPELDPGTLAGAITLLLGSLAILRGRRPARASHRTTR